MAASPIFREVLSNALAYWEKRRLLYNVVLLVIVVVMILLGQPESRSLLSFTGGMTLLTLAVAANIVYCAAYVPDIALQLSDYREGWLKRRKWLFWFGLVFAGLLTFWVMGVGLVSLWLSSAS
jgi:hypothetical protein